MTTEFVSLATSLAKYYGYPDLPMVTVPHPFNNLQEEEVVRLADRHAPEILSAIVRNVGSDLRTHPGSGS